jgi:hypothetical protein
MHHGAAKGRGAATRLRESPRPWPVMLAKGRTIQAVGREVSMRDTLWPGLSEMLAKGRSLAKLDPGPRTLLLLRRIAELV